MEKYRNEHNQECYRGVEAAEPFSSDLFHKPEYQPEDGESFAFHSELGSLTVLDRLTGYSGYVRDTESGYLDKKGCFWLASGNLDVRLSDSQTVGEAIDWVKSNANTCVGYDPLEDKIEE